MASPTELRLKIVQLRMRFLNRTDMPPAQEERLLSEIEELNRQLRLAERASGADAAAERRWAKRIQVDVPCRYVALRPGPIAPDTETPPGPAEWKRAKGAEIVNVSRGGLLLAAPESLGPGTVLWIEVRDARAGGAKGPFAMRSTVVRALPDGSRFLVGLEWIGFSAREVSEMEAALQVSLEREEGAVHAGQIAGPDRRRHKRHVVAVPLRFIIVRLPPVDWSRAKAKAPVIGSKRGEGQNLSRGGMLFTTEVPVFQGSSLSLEIAAPDGSGAPVRARGDALRVVERAGRYEVGVRFTDPVEIEAELFGRLLRLHSA